MSRFQPDYTATLRRLMAAAEIPSFRALCRQAQVSDWTVRQVRRGQIGQLRVHVVEQLSQALGVPLAMLLQDLGGPRQTAPPPSPQLRQEYERLRTQLDEQAETVKQAVQQQALQIIEPWLLQWPTAAHAVQQNPELPATRLLPLLHPLDKLLATWQVRAIASVGAEVPYDPKTHDLMHGTAQPGQPVRIRYPGYYHGERLLYRARVSPVPSSG